MRRRNFAIVCSAIFVLSIILSLLSNEYWVQIVLFFLLFSSLFHTILGFWTAVTEQFVKGTDYVYFLLGITGLIIASVAQSGERSESYINLITYEFPGNFKQVSQETETFIQWCDGFPWNKKEDVPYLYRLILSYYGNKLASETCDSLQKAQTIAASGDYDRIPAFLNEITTNKFYRTFGTLTIGSGIPTRHTIDPIVLWLVSSNLQAIYYRQSPNNTSVSEDKTFATVSVKYFLSQLWPFILALAIALKITRVTADVTGWQVRPVVTG